MTMVEQIYQRELIRKLRHLFPDCVVLKNDPTFIQGIPDLTVLFKSMWAMLEIKLEEDSRRRPNQEYYVRMFNEMSFAAFIHPGNEEEVLNDLQSAFGSTRETRISKPQ